MKYIAIICVALLIVVAGTQLSILHYKRITYVSDGNNPNNQPQESSNILIVGDVMMGRNVELLMDKNGDNYPFVFVSELLQSVDTVVANLEGPIHNNHVRTPSQSVKFDFHPRMAVVLAQNNIKIVSLANNHTFDFGAGGYAETAAYLRSAKVEYFGHPFAYGTEDILRTTIKGKKFTLVGFNITNPNFEYKKALDFVATIPRASDEFFVAFNHGGTEYELVSHKNQQDFYRGLVDAGIDVVIGAHPHVTQEIEIYNGKAIFYSLGNFIFDQYWSKDVEQGYAIKLTFVDNKPHYEIIPIQSTRSQPKLMEGEQKELFLKVLAERSTINYKAFIEIGELEP